MADDIIPKPRIKRNGTTNRGKGTPANLVRNTKGRPFEAKWDWAPVEERYVKGYDKTNEETGIIYRYYPTALEVAAEFNMPAKTVVAQCTDKGWVAKRDAFEAELKRLKDEADLREILDAELRIRRKALKGAEKIIDRVAGTTEQTSLVDGAIPEDLPALAVSLRRAQETAHVAIGLPKDGVRQPGTDGPGKDGKGITTVWARLHASRQDVVVGVQVSTT